MQTDRIRLTALEVVRASKTFRVAGNPVCGPGLDRRIVFQAHHLMGALDFPAAVGEIGEAAKFLLAEGSPKARAKLVSFFLLILLLFCHKNKAKSARRPNSFWPRGRPRCRLFFKHLFNFLLATFVAKSARRPNFRWQ